MRRARGRGRAGGAISPAQRLLAQFGSAQRLFLRADLGITMGTGVAAWADQSINAFHASQGTAAQQPTVNSNWRNGKPGLVFATASSQRLSANCALLADGSPWSVFIVGSRTNDPDAASANDAWFNINGTAGHRCQSTTIAGTSYVATVSTNQTLTTPQTFGFGTSPASLVWTDEGNTGANAMTFRANGTNKPVTGSRPDSSGITSYDVAGLNAAWFDGTIGECRVLNRVATAADLAAWDSYVRWFWNI